MSDETQPATTDADPDENGGGDPASSSRSEDDGQDYIDRSSIDFDPDEGLLTGTAIDGNSDIPGPHERGEDS